MAPGSETASSSSSVNGSTYASADSKARFIVYGLRGEVLEDQVKAVKWPDEPNSTGACFTVSLPSGIERQIPTSQVSRIVPVSGIEGAESWFHKTLEYLRALNR